MYKKIIQISRKTGVPTKKILDMLYLLRLGNPIENNQLLQSIGVSKNSLNQVKKLFADILLPSSKTTRLKPVVIKDVSALFDTNYQIEDEIWSFLDNGNDTSVINKIITKYKNARQTPDRNYDQFTATIETVVKRAQLLNFFEDIKDKRVLFLGDDDFTSVAVASIHMASKITVLDIDDRILHIINSISQKENFGIQVGTYDARKSLPASYTDQFDIVFTDPPYTPEGITLFVSRAIQALDHSNQSARIYVCYGNSDRARERFLPIYKVFISSGLMIRWVFDNYNKYSGAESIGDTSSLFVLDITAKTKPLILNNYDKPIYTNN